MTKAILRFAAGEFFAPAGGPDFDAFVFEFITIFDDIGDSDGGVHEVFGEFDFEVRRVGELKKVVVCRGGA